MFALSRSRFGAAGNERALIKPEEGRRKEAPVCTIAEREECNSQVSRQQPSDATTEIRIRCALDGAGLRSSLSSRVLAFQRLFLLFSFIHGTSSRMRQRGMRLKPGARTRSLIRMQEL